MSPETMALRELRGDALIAALMSATWYVKPNDLIGGWCVMPVNEMPSAGCCEVADFLGREIAEHIVALHNADLAA